MTDGVTEARHGQELYGEESVRRLVAAAPLDVDADALAQRIERAALAFGAGYAVDDIAVLVVRVPR
jgi:serine phosphatase RsbU (regulator of sigma subunit)